LLTAVFAMMLLTWFGWEPVVSRMSTLWTGAVFGQEARLPMWARCWPLIKAFPVWGTGYGTFQYVEPMALHTATSVGRSWLYAHNEYLQGLLEGGLVGLTLGLTLLGCVFYMGQRALRAQADQPAWGLVLGGVFGVTATSIHGFVEFGLHIPAIAVLFTVVCAQLCGIASPPRPGGQAATEGHGSPSETVVRCFGLAPLFAVVLAVALGWLLISQSRKAVIVDVLQRRAEYLRDAAPAESLPRQIACLNRAVFTQPNNAELHLQLGRAQLEFFDVLQDRHPDVARRWQKPLRQALLIPGLRHLLEARDLCPVWPESHALIAAHVDRLSAADPRSAYIERAERLVPADPLLWYTAGIQQLADGQPDKAWRSWNRALQLSDTNLTLILNRCAGHLTPQETLDRVLPDRPEILLAAARHLCAGPTAVAQRRPFLERALAAWNRHCSSSSADDLYVKTQIYRLLEEPEPALAAIRDALLEDPDRFGWRYEYATMLYAQGHLADARRQLDPVLGQRPQHAQAQELLDTITRRIAEGGK
jgi:tetratricopeptide (TPR) repeat protein